MSSAPIEFLNLLVDYPGDLLYFMIMVAVTLAGLLIALGERLRSPGLHSALQYSTAFGGTWLAWTLLMLGALFNVLTDQNPVAILPPLERAINVVVILLITWAFVTADAPGKRRAATVILILMLVITIIGYIVTGIEWPGLVGQTDFNLTNFGFAWTFVPALITAIGLLLVLVYFRSVLDAPLKIVCLSLILLGHLGTLWQLNQGMLIGHYAGISRLAFLAALPMAVMVVYRMVIGALQTDIVRHTGAGPSVTPTGIELRPEMPESLPGTILPPMHSTPILSPLQRDSVQLLKTLGLILEEAGPSDIPQRIITAALEVLKGDVGAVLALQDANYADIVAAYDKVLEHPIPGIALNLDNQPTLVNTIERRLQRPLFPDRNPEELSDLYTRLDIAQTGPTYLQPLTSGQELVGILIVGMPYSGRELSDSERELLKGIGVIAGSLLALSLAAQDARLKAEERAIQALVQGVPLDRLQDTSAAAAQDIQDSLQLARDQVQDLSRQVVALQRELDQERTRISSTLGDTEEGMSVSQRILALHEEQAQLREEREQLAARLQEAETALVSATAVGGDALLRRMVESLRREKAELTAQRDALQTQLNELRQGGTGALGSAQEALERMAQEKARLETEREQLRAQLADLETQLAALGIEDGPARLLQLANQISEQRAAIQTLTLERDTLLKERAFIQDAIQNEKEREARIQMLQTEIQNLAVDRETAIRQRDQLRAERDELLERQDLNKQQRARLLAEASGYQMELAEAHQEQAKLRQQIEELIRERDQWLQQRSANMPFSQETVDHVTDQGTHSVIPLSSSDDQQVEALTRQRDRLQIELEAARSALRQTAYGDPVARLGAISELSDDLTADDFRMYNPDLILGMVQELRTPMTSIVGYVNLLLDEAAGILGEMQRKFLQRVAANITRMTSMLDDLTRVAALDSDRFTLTPRPLDIVNLIEDVITDSSTQFREKGLTVHLNLDDHLPRVRADHDAVHQIVKQLLTNAYLVSPTGSQIFITAHQQPVKLSQNARFSSPVDSILISVEDRGGGIAHDDLPRVFARKYKADNPLVMGLGDTGVGLSIAKTLAEAHGGGLWLETREGIGSIFYFALPVTSPSAIEG